MCTVATVTLAVGKSNNILLNLKIEEHLMKIKHIFIVIVGFTHVISDIVKYSYQYCTQM